MDNFLNLAINAAKMAGSVIKSDFYSCKDVAKKGPVNLVTETDKKCENLIVDKIKIKFPKHKILSEEGTSIDNVSGYRWIIDPLDGTTNFVNSFPFVAVSIALELNGETILGVVYNPILNELFTGVKGKGAFLNNNEKLKVSDVDKIQETLIATGFPYERFQRAKKLGKIVEIVCANAQGLRRTGSASMDLCYVAAGRFDAYFEEDLKPWDIAAGMLIVEEAGGVTCDYFGHTVDYDKCDIVACGKNIRPTILSLLKKAIK